jgi:hypothetical protein
MVNEFLVRVGTFLILLGMGMLILFIASDYAKQSNFDYLFWAVLAVTVGFMLRRRKAPPPPSGRFESLRKWTGRSGPGDKEDKQR